MVRDGAEATQDFVGPLDLILHLLQKNRIAVRDIPLAGILAQFLTWMSSRRALDLEVAGEFISMASHLMLLKTRMLLSEQDQEAQSEMEELIASLEATPSCHENYARILAVLPQLSEGYQQGRAAFPKGPEPQFARRVYRYVHSGEDLRAAVAAWQAANAGRRPLPWRNSEGLAAAGALTQWKKRRRSSSPFCGRRDPGGPGGPDPPQREPLRGHGHLSGAVRALPGGKDSLGRGDGQPGGLLQRSGTLRLWGEGRTRGGGDGNGAEIKWESLRVSLSLAGGAGGGNPAGPGHGGCPRRRRPGPAPVPGPRL
ncbi:MAG: segregation and condensation protein A [Evtepia gabavorous]